MIDISGFTNIFPAVTLSWIIIELWGNVINVVAYKTMGLDANSAITVTLVAIVITLVLYFAMSIRNTHPNHLDRDNNN